MSVWRFVTPYAIRTASQQQHYRCSVSVAADIRTSATSVTVAELVALRKSVGKLNRRTGRRVKAPMVGSSSSAALGRGLDFAEVREYHGGDDVRLIDWKVTARTGRAHTKLFNEERERPFFIALDLRPAMYFGTKVALKSVVAARLCAIVAWAAAAQRDRVGGLVFDNTRITEIKPQAGSRGVTRLLHQIVKFHSAAVPDDFNSTPLSDALMRLDRCAHTGSSICLVSDFNQFDSGPHTANLLQHNHTAAVRIYDPLEAELPPPAEYTITDGISKGRLNSASARARQQYLDDFNFRKAQLERVFSGAGNRFINASVVDDPVEIASLVMNSLPGSL